MSSPAAVRERLLLLGEVSLALATVAAVLSLGRLFEGQPYLPEVVVAALAAHAVAFVCRRLGIGAGTTLLTGVVAAVLVVTWTQLPDTTNYGVPTGRTLDQARAELSDAWHAFGQVVAPAPFLPGFVLACSIAAWIIAFVADAAAFRARATLEAIVPATALFIFGGALGDGPQRWGVNALFVAAVLAHWLAQRSHAAASSTTWLVADGAGVSPVLRTGAVLVVVGTLAAVVGGPHLPGADAESVVEWRASDRDRPSARVTISPLVDIRRRLVDQANVEVFSVTSSRRAYWRLTSLEQFDGRIWSSNRRYRRASGRLGSDADNSRVRGETVRQQFTIEALSSFWLPAAFQPNRIEGTKARYDTDSNSLLTEAATANGLSYEVESVIPDLDPAALMSVPPIAPQHIVDEYTALPEDFSAAVRRLALQVVAGRGFTTQYERARALQDYFRSPPFVYDLDVPEGHGGEDLENFLFRTHRGYCEQYAGAYAAMARVIGLPARVAVGFTPGEWDGGTGYAVFGFNGHAWPEVYLDGYGWIAFEPTPGRGMPGAQAYTGVPESQAQAGNPSTATTLPVTTTTIAGGGGVTSTTAPGGTGTTPSDDQEDDTSPWVRRLLLAVLAVVLLPLAWIASLAAVRAAQHRRRRAAATTPEHRVLLAWDEVAEALARAGTAREPWETPAEFASRAVDTTGLDPELLDALAAAATAAGYRPDGVAPLTADDAARASATLRRAADELIARRERLRGLVDPRPLMGAHESRMDVSETVVERPATARRA